MIYTRIMSEVLIFCLLVCFEVICAHNVSLVEDFYHLNSSRWNVIDRQSAVNPDLLFTPDAVRCIDGNLRIRCEKRQAKQWTSARLDTQHKFAVLYGVVEFQVKIPKGQGIHTVIGLNNPICSASASNCGMNWPPSVMVAEIYGREPDRVFSTVYYGSANGSPGFPSVSGSTKEVGDLSADYHTYRLAWWADCLVTSVDGVVVQRLSESTQIPQVPLQIVMLLSIGGTNSAGDPDETTVYPADLLIDYISVQPTPEYDARLCGEAVAATAPDLLVPLLGSLAFACLMGVVMLWKRRYLVNLLFQKVKGTAAWDLLQTGDVVLDTLLKTYICRIQIPAGNVDISEQVLGKGEFGIVYKGTALGLPGQPTKYTTVAIKKVIQPVLDADQQRQLKEEIRVMTKVGRHLNAVNLLGIVLSRGYPWLVLEYCRYGSLLTYLKLHRGAFFYNHVDAAGGLLPFDEVQQTSIALEAQQTSSRRASFPEENFDGLVMATRDLISFAYQISRGMEYLASRSVIHRDLAARNVLVADKKVAKIADFGMARQLSVYVLKDEQAAIPLRWLPPEAITSRRFSQKTDVWSYGILLWEVFSLGDIPFSGLGLGDSVGDFVIYLNNGGQMERPLSCPLDIYAVQQLCWQLTAEERPTFLDVRTQLDKLISADHVDCYLGLEEPYRRFNEINHQFLAADDTPDADVQAGVGSV